MKVLSLPESFRVDVNEMDIPESKAEEALKVRYVGLWI
jgi:hypothetical protein